MQVGDVYSVEGKDGLFRIAHIHSIKGDVVFGDMFLQTFVNSPVLSDVYNCTEDKFKLGEDVIKGAEIRLGKNYMLLGLVPISSSQKNWMDILDDLE